MSDATSVWTNNTQTQAAQLEDSFAMTARQAQRGKGFATRTGVAGITITLGQDEIMTGGYMTMIQG